MAKKILKLTIPGLDKGASLQQYLDFSNPLLEKWKIELNNPNLKCADAWCVIENLDPQDNQCQVDQRNTYFFAAETAQNLGHIEESHPMKNFLAQFSHVYTYHQYFGSGAKSQPPFLPWMINANHGESIFMNHERDVHFFQNLNHLNKTKLLSVICSTQELTPAHKMRLRFVQQLEKHFTSDLDWFGNGVNSVSEKWQAMAPYKYTIALENQSRHNVITEKLGDSFLALSYPFYWGAPNANQFFNPDGFSQINIEDFDESVKIIEEILCADKYSEKLPILIENKNRVLHDFNFINRILEICNSNSTFDRPTNLRLNIRSEFDPGTLKVHNLIGGFLNSKLSRLDEIWGTNLLNIVKDLYILCRYNKLANKISRLLN